MINRIVEMLLLGILVFNPIMETIKKESLEKLTYIDMFRKMDGFTQGLIILIIQASIYIVYYCVTSIAARGIKFSSNITTSIENEYYGTNFSLIYFDEIQAEETKDFLRKLQITIKISYYNKLHRKLISRLLKNLYIYYEIERDDITLQSQDRNAEETEFGIKYSLNNFINKHLSKNDEGNYTINIRALLGFEKEFARDNNEEEYIYPRILTKDKKESRIAKLLIKNSLENHKIKVIINRKEEVNE